MPYLRAFLVFSPHLRHFMHPYFFIFPAASPHFRSCRPCRRIRRISMQPEQPGRHTAGSAEQICRQVFDRVEYFVSACLDELLRDFITFLILFFL